MCCTDEGREVEGGYESAPALPSEMHGLLLLRGGWDLRQVTLMGNSGFANHSWMLPTLPASLISWGLTSQPPNPIRIPHTFLSLASDVKKDPIQVDTRLNGVPHLNLGCSD